MALISALFVAEGVIKSLAMIRNSAATFAAIISLLSYCISVTECQSFSELLFMPIQTVIWNRLSPELYDAKTLKKFGSLFCANL